MAKAKAKKRSSQGKDAEGATNKKAKKVDEEEVEEAHLGDKSLEEFLQGWGDEEEEDGVEEEDEEDSSDQEDSANKDYLSKLSEKDPELFQYLQENDKELLDNMSDELDEEEDNEEAKLHRLPKNLEVASDESDFEDEEGEELEKAAAKGVRQKVTIKALNALEKRLEDTPSVGTVSELAQMFKAALLSLGAGGGGKKDDDKRDETSAFTVQGSTMFNAVVRLCLLRMAPSLYSILGVTESEAAKQPSRLAKSKHWSSLNRSLRSYTSDLTRLLSSLTEEAVHCALLKHCHSLLPLFAAQPKAAKHLTARLVQLWSAGEESARVLAFLCLVRVTRVLQMTNFDAVVKAMYMSYVRNCRFTSPSAWPLINFMRRSLAELLALDPAAAYNLAFVYVRQLGISLRNALTTQKKEAVQAVHNWQFVHSCHLWAHLLESTAPSKALSPLVFPLTQVMQGCIRLTYTARFFPLRFHMCGILSGLSAKTGAFVPVLPHYLDVLGTFNFNKKTSKVSMRPLDFSSVLKIGKAQMQDNGMKDATIDKVGFCLFVVLTGSSQGSQLFT